MSPDVLSQHWPEIRRDVPRYWGKLTADDLETVAGQFEPFVRALRKRYGFSQLKAEDELTRYLSRFNWPAKSS